MFEKPLSAVAAAILFLFALPWAHAPVHAQTYPVRPIRIVVPFPPGGTSDILARSIGQKLAEEWGQPVLTDHRTNSPPSLNPRS